jgi:peptidyl-tRNA hydrolase, PTH2 family
MFIDYDSPEEVTKRATQEDPIVMYLIVRESLGMSIGKTAAQCAHASQMLQLQYQELSYKIEQYWPLPHEAWNYDGSNIPQWMKDRSGIFDEWINSSFRKVVLKADDKEWEKVKAAFPEDFSKIVVVDAGLTEIAAGSETVIGLWPMKKSLVPKVVKRLQVLK